MRSFLFSLAILTLLGPLPSRAQQYLEPEDVLLQQGTKTGPPTNSRSANDQGIAQQSANQQRHPVTLQDSVARTSAAASSQPSGNTSSADATAGLHEAAPSAPATTVTFDPVTARLLQRLEREQNARLAGGPSDVEHSTALHSAAPLTGSGPAEDALIGLAIAAIGWTVWQAGKKRQWIVQ
jgi:hypothetical protein